MADKKEIHPAVELLLARMGSHPEEFVPNEKVYTQENSRTLKMSSMYGDILNRASEEEVALLRAAMNKIQLDILHHDLMDELLNGDERRAKEEQEYERNLSKSLMLTQRQMTQQAQQALQQAYVNPMGQQANETLPGAYASRMGQPLNRIVSAGSGLKVGTLTASQPEPILSPSAINQIKQALGIKK